MTHLKSTLAMTAAIVFATFFTSCGSAQKQNHENDVPMDEAVSQEQVQSGEVTKAQAKEILSAYLEIKDALVQTDGEAASAAATKLVSAIGESKDAIVEKIRFDAEHIADTKDAAHQRDHFNSLTEQVYAVVKATEANESALYRQYCPMAMNNKGAYWLSTEKEIKNPYFGDKMLKCGSVKETIN